MIMSNRVTGIAAVAAASTTLIGGASAQTYEFVGSWNVGDGPRWNAQDENGNFTTQIYTAQEAAALLFGGDASDYAVSTVSDEAADINFSAWVDGWGDSATYAPANGNPAPQDFSFDIDGDGLYASPGGDGSSYSAYVSDHGTFIDATNYAFLIFLGPTSAEEIARFAAAASTNGRIIVLNARELARMRGQDSLATRDAMRSLTRVTDAETGEMSVTQSTRAQVGMMGNVYTWVDITGFHADDDDAGRSYTGRGLQIGADIALSPDMVAGLSFGVQDLDSSVGAFNQDGTLRFIQPYLAYRSGAWSGEASLIYGHGDYDQTSAGGDGSGSTRLAALTFTGGYDMAMDGFVLTPTFGFAHGREKIEGETGTLANAGSETVRFTQASLGAEIRTDVSGGEFFAGLHADWLNTSSDTALVSDLLVDDGWTGRIELGVSTAMGNGVELATSLELSGLGGDLTQTSGALRFAFRF